MDSATTQESIVKGIFTHNVSVSSNLLSHPTAFLDIILVTLIFYWLYLLIRQTRALRILYGIVFLVALWIVGQLLELTTLNFLLGYAMTGIVVAIPVVFQPELRAGLEKLGRTEIVTDFQRFRQRTPSATTPLNIVTEVAEVLAHRKIGSIIAMGRKTGLREYVDTGIRLDAQLSTELLISIFTPQSALHDGAVVLQGNKIVAAKVILPLSDSKFDYHLGTRHRASVGLATQSDAVVIIVSEERGEISLAHDGILKTNLTSEELHKQLQKLLTPTYRKKNP